jgi:hypothetical protein
MNSRKRSIPVKDVDFNISQKVIVSKSDQNRTDWGLDSEWLDDKVLPEQAEWETAWLAYEDPATRTPIINFTKAEKRKKFEKTLRQLVKILQSNIHVTDDDLRAMSIVIPSSSRTPAKVATTYPDYDIDSSTIRWLRIIFYDQGQKRSKARPEGQRCAIIKWIVSNIPPTSINDLTNTKSNTSTPFSLEFDESDRGKTVYFCLCWENTRGERGPWSEIQSAIIP